MKTNKELLDKFKEVKENFLSCKRVGDFAFLCNISRDIGVEKEFKKYLSNIKTTHPHLDERAKAWRISHFQDHSFDSSVSTNVSYWEFSDYDSRRELLDYIINDLTIKIWTEGHPDGTLYSYGSSYTKSETEEGTTVVGSIKEDGSFEWLSLLPENKKFNKVLNTVIEWINDNTPTRSQLLNYLDHEIRSDDYQFLFKYYKLDNNASALADKIMSVHYSMYSKKPCKLHDTEAFPKDNEPNHEGARFNKGKLRYDLVDPIAMREIVKVLTQGAEKYGDRNWEKGLGWMGVIASCKRHLAEFELGHDIDKESGLLHLAHAVANLMYLLTYSVTYPQGDDRVYKDKGELIEKYLGRNLQD